MSRDKKKQREYQKNWMRARRSAFFTGKRCQKCGECENLEIHHRDPSQKIHHAVWSWSEKRRNDELAKCDVLCASCHQEHHAELLRDKEHGTGGMYRRVKCRCDLCRRWNRDKGRRERSKRADNSTDRVPAF